MALLLSDSVGALHYPLMVLLTVTPSSLYIYVELDRFSVADGAENPTHSGSQRLFYQQPQ